MGMRISSATLAVVAALFVLALAAGPATAHHKAGHLGGGGNGRASSAAEEENQDGDEGDNAHPSGKDRTVENGGSGNQGSSESDPDDDGRGPDRSNGGADKPNGPGGVDKADQDGNNGCGNDDDFEDDNEGWCGGKPRPARPATPAKPEVKPVPEVGTADEAVLGGLIERPATPTVETDETAEEPEVLAGRLTRAAESATPDERAASALGGELPFTGSALLGWGAIGVGLALAGGGLLTARRRI